MKFDTRLTPTTLVLAVFSCLIPFFADFSFPLDHGLSVEWVENAQALWLFFGFLFTLRFACSTALTAGSKAFWLWAALWWLVLLGRSTSWGRDYFPGEPRLLFRLISVLLIGALVLFVFFSRALRDEILNRLRNETFLVWTFGLVVVTFLISDSVEHHRLIAHFFLHKPAYQDLIEELYEIPFMVGLFCVSYDLMQRQKSVSHQFAMSD
ncbi:hypothetical protein Q5705_00520 [Kosakonia sp. H02]|nr:hypothetical protein Q5705_00520 [Kosakonia sp. H02]